MLAMHRPTTTADGRHRHRAEPVGDALGRVGLHGRQRLADAEGHGLGEHAGHQELLVVAAAGDDDPAAEDVGEQQHEDDREDQAPDDHLGLADPLGDVALGDDRPGRRAERPQSESRAHAATSCSSAVRRSARPVPGEPEEHVVEGRAAQADVGDGDAGVGQRPDGLGQRRDAVGDRRADPARCRRRPRAPARRRGRRCRPPRPRSRPVVDDDLEPVAAHLRLQLLGRARRRSPCRRR